MPEFERMRIDPILVMLGVVILHGFVKNCLRTHITWISPTMQGTELGLTPCRKT
jgi:hypothetical protein